MLPSFSTPVLSLLRSKFIAQHAALWPGGRAGLDRAFKWVLRIKKLFEFPIKYNVSAIAKRIVANYISIKALLAGMKIVTVALALKPLLLKTSLEQTRWPWNLVRRMKST